MRGRVEEREEGREESAYIIEFSHTCNGGKKRKGQRGKKNVPMVTSSRVRRDSTRSTLRDSGS